MTAQSLARAAYGRPEAAIRTPRAIEYDLFARVTHQLRASTTPGALFAALAQALHDNRLLWSTLANDVLSDGNGLPSDLRARLFYLSEFTQTHSRKVLAGQADAVALIEVNTAVMRGLRPEETRR
ncbi:MAG TPA: flagellar biosynthesis regulator FlaF [Paracoccaceae bacterium]|nr:flagellar biosynthesis regulator FlaF [Paracoccaceae bacterium]